MHHQDIVSAINVGNPNFQSYINHLSSPLHMKLEMINELITQQSALMGVNDIIIGSGIMILLLIPLIFLARRPIVK